MNDYLALLNEHYNKRPLSNWYEGDIFNFENFKNDEIYSIFTYYFYSEKPILKDNEAEILLLNYSQDLNIYVRAIMDYLISCCKTHYADSKLVSVCDSIIQMYFERIEEFQERSPVHILSRVIKWTIYKFPNAKKLISNTIFHQIINGKLNELRLLNTVNYLINDGLESLFSVEQYCAFYERFSNADVNVDNCLLYYSFYKRIIEIITNHKEKLKKHYFESLADFVLKYIAFFDEHTKFTDFQNIIDAMDFVGKYSDGDYYLMRSELEKVNKLHLKRMTEIEIEIPEEITNSIRKAKESAKNIFESYDNDEKINVLLSHINVFRIDSLSKDISQSKAGFGCFVRENILDEGGRLINYKKLKEAEQFSLDSREYIRFHVDVCFDILITPFYSSFVMDDKAKLYIKQIIDKCPFIVEERKDYITDLFILFFEKNFKHSIYDIVLEFEDILRNYFKSQKLNVYKKDGSGDFIGLNNVFNNNKKNSFREKLYETINENYYFTLKWLLTDEYGFDLRDKISHRIKSNNLYLNTNSIVCIFYILRIIMAF